MSASREKKKRQEGQAAAAKNAGKQSRVRPLHILYAVLAVVLVVVFVFVALVGNGFFNNRATAMTVGEHKVTASMYNIFYMSLYSNYYNSYADYIDSYGYPFSSSEPLDEQIYDTETGQTWADYFKERAQESLVWTFALTDAAAEAGYTLSEDGAAEIDELIAGLDDTATTYGYHSANGYLTAYFGAGVDTELYREFLELQYLANEYQEQMESSFTYTEDELLAYYEENKVDFDVVTYRTYFVDGQAESETVTDEETGEETTVEPTEEESEAAMTAAQETAEAMADATSGDESAFIGYAYLLENELTLGEDESYSDYAAEDYEDATTEHRYSSYSTATGTLEAMAEWLFDESRQPGDTAALSAENGYYVVYFGERSDNNYSTVNVRHILIEPEDVEDVTDEDGNVDEEATAEAEEQAKADALAEAEALLDEFLAGDATEDSFATLAEENTDDTGSSSTGGLYEGVYRGQMVQAFEDWCFDESRQPGDTGIVESDYGYHIMYFVGLGDNYRDTLVDTAMRTENYNAWYEEISAAYTVAERGFGMRFVTD